ncbi:MAG: peptidoglycan DD-metalloendopeptidase family protein, partial [Thiotrichaceae bacterium]|nr:peptidoglycan DD-metalloendopeptidase family protein [Thiotrichaceae bacterium]
LKKQSKVVRSQEQKLSKLKRDESRLRGVIQKLAQKQRKKELERSKAKSTIANSKNRKEPKSAKSVDRHYVPNAAFSSLRGKLSWPVRGRLTHKYGSARNSKIKWNGVIISAAGGTNVHAVARGKIEFSGRLNGYGYVIIIRHDKNYRSLYAYNRSVYKRVGQVVKAGEIIAAVGNSGRLASPGLYFEISKGSVHQNPARWCR